MIGGAKSVFRVSSGTYKHVPRGPKHQITRITIFCYYLFIESKFILVSPLLKIFKFSQPRT